MSVISYKCQNCGGDLRFDPKTQRYKCEYCLSDFNQEELENSNSHGEEKQAAQGETNQNTNHDTNHDTNEEGAVVYSCPSCGAEIVTDATTAATFCYYCHNPVVLSGKLSGEYKPDSIIPFMIDKKQAVEEFLAFVGKKKFVPRQFFCKEQIEKISGVYFPFWRYECELSGGLEGEATKVRIYHTGDIEFTETKFYHVGRGGNIRFEDLSKNALKKANKELVEGVQPFHLKDAQSFKMGFLSGFLAEKRDMEKSDFQEGIRQEVDSYAKSLLKDSVQGYATVNVKNVSIRKDMEDWSYLLLPVWVLTYKGGDGKLYYYAMNGQTKQICGKFPVDYMRLLLFFAMIAIPVFVLLLLGGYFIW